MANIGRGRRTCQINRITRRGARTKQIKSRCLHGKTRGLDVVVVKPGITADNPLYQGQIPDTMLVPIDLVLETIGSVRGE